MDTKSGYKVNEDGSVTRIIGGSNNNSNNKGGPSHKGGWIWVVIIAVVVGIVVGFVTSRSNSGSSCEVEAPDSTLTPEECAAMVAEPATEAAPPTTYLNVSDDDIYMSSYGGSIDIAVSTDGEWDIDTDVASWGHLDKYSNYVTLKLEENSSSSSRTDYFTIRSGDYTKTINITQSGDTSPRANIENIWVDHNVYQDGYKGMKIHVKFTVDNMNGQTVYAYCYLYYGDNVTPLQDRYYNNLFFSGSGVPGYDSARFDDFKIFVPYSGLNMQPVAGSVDLSFDISIRTSSGTELGRKNNTRFTYSQG